MDLQTTVRCNMVDYLVGRTLTCPRTGEVLDSRTAVVLVDTDGDPAAVMSQAGWAEFLTLEDYALRLAGLNLTVDPATVKGA